MCKTKMCLFVLFHVWSQCVTIGGEGGQFKLLIVDNTDGHMEKQKTEMKREVKMETRKENWNRNGNGSKEKKKNTNHCMVQCFLHSVLNHVLSHYNSCTVDRENFAVKIISRTCQRLNPRNTPGARPLCNRQHLKKFADRTNRVKFLC